MLDRFGLEASLREGPIQRLLESAAIRFEARTAGPIESIGQDTGSAIYRICQEAATNCVRHAQARSFRIQLDAAPAWAGSVEVHLRIEDDGRGFSPNHEKDEGLGLIGMRERVGLAGGRLEVESSSAGTTIVAEVPI